MKPCLTILTPLYNRGEFIDRLYYCLSAQTRKDFQWLIIDDGSDTDFTEKFAEYSNYADFTIEYHRKENGGKHTALNYAHPFIKADWVLILDNDDLLLRNAVELCAEYTDNYSADPEIGIVSFLKGTDKKTSAVKFKPLITVSDYISYRINGNRPGDCCEVVRTNVLLEYPFPVFVGEKFLGEAHLWLSSAEKYKTVYIPRIIYIYEYLEDGLSSKIRDLHRSCPMGSMHNQILGLNPKCSLKYRIKRALLLHYYGRLLKMKAKDICRDSGYPKFVSLFSLPGHLLYLYWEKNQEK